MAKLSAAWRLATTWYISLLVLAGVGALIGFLAFYYISPGKPRIGIIDIPLTVLSEDSAFVIGEFLNYARRTDSVKAVVIRLESPGGGAAASEKLYAETRKLREKKPVVIVMNGVVASGGYMMSLGANYTYAKASSLVGSVGVILASPGPMIPDPPSEQLVESGPSKLGGGGRRHFIALVDELKQAFVHMVVAERGGRLQMSPEDVAQAKIYSGVESVRLGLVDAIGDESEAIEKAASLAGISNYDVLDVNVEVFRIFYKKLARILEPLAKEGGGGALVSKADALLSLDIAGAQPAGGNLAMLRRLYLPSGMDESQEDALPGFPLRVRPPNAYYLYVGPSE